jgi:hypothetical protein
MAYRRGDGVKKTGDDTKYVQLLADAETNGVDPALLQKLQGRYPNIDLAELAAHLVEARHQLSPYGEHRKPATETWLKAAGKRAAAMPARDSERTVRVSPAADDQFPYTNDADGGGY